MRRWRHGRMHGPPLAARWHDRRLHQHLFVWLALTILATVAVSALVLNLLQPARAPFDLIIGRAADFVSRQFEQRWHDERARDALARDLAHTFDASVSLRSVDGRLLLRAGPEGCQGPRYDFDIEESGPGSPLLGRVEACMTGLRRFRPAIGLIVLGSVCLVLWTAAALLARRIARPLSLLIDTTREIGSGNLSARVRLGRHQHGELRLLAESVNDMAGRIERQMKDQRELLAAVSHEVRSPLARLRLSAEILRADPANAPALDSIELEVVELDGLVGQLLASSRLDFETLSKQEVPLGDLFRRVLARHQIPASHLDDQSQNAVARVDTTLIARALDNLLDNAVRHGGSVAGCRLCASAAVAGSELIFEVRDAGSGFAEHVLPNVFEAFYRGPGPSSGAPASLGLGLALVRRIALAHGGRAWAENIPGGGALVAFSVMPGG
jgi:two-component system, OmpR family, sensor kinase